MWYAVMSPYFSRFRAFAVSNRPYMSFAPSSPSVCPSFLRLLALFHCTRAFLCAVVDGFGTGGTYTPGSPFVRAPARARRLMWSDVICFAIRIRRRLVRILSSIDLSLLYVYVFLGRGCFVQYFGVPCPHGGAPLELCSMSVIIHNF